VKAPSLYYNQKLMATATNLYYHYLFARARLQKRLTPSSVASHVDFLLCHSPPFFVALCSPHPLCLSSPFFIFLLLLFFSSITSHKQLKRHTKTKQKKPHKTLK